MALLLSQYRGPQPWSSRGCRLVARQLLCSQVDLHDIRRFSFPTTPFAQIQSFFFGGNLKTSQFFRCGQLCPTSFPSPPTKIFGFGTFFAFAMVLLSLALNCRRQRYLHFKCSLTIKLTANFSLTGSLFCIRALYQQNSLPRIHSSLLQLIATYSFINWTQLLLWPAFWPK